jgi:uncharacterized protein (TIGR04255 family)
MSDFSLRHPPLICVAARVEFTPVESIGKHLPGLQESLRLGGYPLADDPVKTKTWRIEDREDGGMNVTFQKFSRWDFANVERTVTIRVDRESVTLLFTEYDHFRNAEPHYRKILAMVETAIPGLLPQVVQLRYIGYIPIEGGTEPTDWVTPTVLGMPNLGPLARRGSVSETSFQTPENGHLVTRCMTLDAGRPALPPDLLPLKARLRFGSPSKSPFILLENVHRQSATLKAFAAETCLAELSALRRYNAEVFQKTVTSKALETWK